MRWIPSELQSDWARADPTIRRAVPHLAVGFGLTVMLSGLIVYQRAPSEPTCTRFVPEQVPRILVACCCPLCTALSATKAMNIR